MTISENLEFSFTLTKSDFELYANIIRSALGFDFNNALDYVKGKKNVLKAEWNFETVSFLSFEIQNENQVLYIDDFDVVDSHQSKGIGSAMLGFLEQFAIQNKIKTVKLHVAEKNERGKLFYLKNGFSLVELVKGFFNGQYHAFCLEKEIIFPEH